MLPSSQGVICNALSSKQGTGSVFLRQLLKRRLRHSGGVSGTLLVIVDATMLRVSIMSEASVSYRAGVIGLKQRPQEHDEQTQRTE